MAAAAPHPLGLSIPVCMLCRLTCGLAMIWSNSTGRIKNEKPFSVLITFWILISNPTRQGLAFKVRHTQHLDAACTISGRRYPVSAFWFMLNLHSRQRLRSWNRCVSQHSHVEAAGPGGAFECMRTS